MNYHDRLDMRQEAALVKLERPGTVGSRAWISAYRRVIRTRHGRDLRLLTNGLFEPAGWCPDPAAVAEAKDEIDHLPAWVAARALRLYRGLGTAETARLAGLSEWTLCAVESGRQRASRKTVRKLLAALAS